MTLSERERCLLRAIGGGASVSEAAQACGCTRRVARRLLERLRQRSGAHSNAALVGLYWGELADRGRLAGVR